jgi:hypothetical protein
LYARTNDGHTKNEGGTLVDNDSYVKKRGNKRKEMREVKMRLGCLSSTTLGLIFTGVSSACLGGGVNLAASFILFASR